MHLMKESCWCLMFCYVEIEKMLLRELVLISEYLDAVLSVVLL